MPDNWDFSRPRRKISNEETPAPLITFGLCLLCVVFTTAYLTSSADSTSAWAKLGHLGLLSNEEIWGGKYYGLLTTFFIHGSIPHIVFNLLWLVQLGRAMETTISPWKYILFMVGACFVSSCAEFAMSGNVGIGASGVVYAMFGLMWTGRKKYLSWGAIATKQNLNIMIGWGVLCIIATKLNLMNIANGAHAGGFLFGLSVGYLIFGSKQRYFWAIPLALLVVTSVLALTWMDWNWEWNSWKGDQAFEHRHYRSSISYYQRSISRGGQPYYLWDKIGAAWHNIVIEEREKHDTAAETYAQAQEQRAQLIIDAEHAKRDLIIQDSKDSHLSDKPDSPDGTAQPDKPRTPPLLEKSGTHNP